MIVTLLTLLPLDSATLILRQQRALRAAFCCALCRHIRRRDMLRADMRMPYAGADIIRHHTPALAFYAVAIYELFVCFRHVTPTRLLPDATLFHAEFIFHYAMSLPL